MEKNKSLFAETAGWYGISAILLGYILVSFELVDPTGVVFQLLNLTGAIGIIIISRYKGVNQSVVLNVFWAIISLIALARVFVG